MRKNVKIGVTKELFIMGEVNYYSDWGNWDSQSPLYLFRKGEEGNSEWVATIEVRKEGEFVGQYWVGKVEMEWGELSDYEKNKVADVLETHPYSQGLSWIINW